MRRVDGLKTLLQIDLNRFATKHTHLKIESTPRYQVVLTYKSEICLHSNILVPLYCFSRHFPKRLDPRSSLMMNETGGREKIPALST